MTHVFATDYELAPDHPALAGHFPGRPLMPGALLLAEVVECARSQPGSGELFARGATLVTVKFLAPVGPGARLRFAFEGDALGLRFVATAAGRAVAEGRWTRTSMLADADASSAAASKDAGPMPTPSDEAGA